MSWDEEMCSMVEETRGAKIGDWGGHRWAGWTHQGGGHWTHQGGHFWASVNLLIWNVLPVVLWHVTRFRTPWCQRRSQVARSWLSNKTGFFIAFQLFHNILLFVIHAPPSMFCQACSPKQRATAVKDKWFSPFSLLFCRELRCLVFEYHIYGQCLPNASSELLHFKMCWQLQCIFVNLVLKGPLTWNTLHLLIMPCNTIQRHIIPHNTIPYNNIQYHSKYTLPFLRIYLPM